MPRFAQPAVSEWEPAEFRPIAVIAAEPKELARRCGLRFEQTHDNLDYVAVALVRLANAHRFMLMRHKNAPEPGTEVHALPKQGKAAELVEELLRTIGAEQVEVTWSEGEAEPNSV